VANERSSRSWERSKALYEHHTRLGGYVTRRTEWVVGSRNIDVSTALEETRIRLEKAY
jgi:hypothetical protein